MSFLKLVSDVDGTAIRDGNHDLMVNFLKQTFNLDESLGIVVMGRDSCPRGSEFESQPPHTRCIMLDTRQINLDTRWIIYHIYSL